MSTITELLDYEYGLTPESIVIDAGAYTGQWAEAVAKRYGCSIKSFEPVSEFYHQLSHRISSCPMVGIHNFALACQDSEIVIGVADNSSGVYAAGEQRIVRCHSIVAVLRPLGDIALLKLNVEGMEYELLETILNFGLIGKIHALQVQCHWNAPMAMLRWAAIKARLADTHSCVKTTDTNWSIWVKRS